MSEIASPFQRQPLLERRLLDRLFSRPRRENALIELKNRLAGDLLSVTPRDVREIEQTYEADLSQDFSEERRALLAKYLEYCYADTVLDQGETERLDHLRSLLRLDEQIVTGIYKRVRERVFRRAVQERFQNRRLSSDEALEIEALQVQLEITDTEARDIKQQEADEVVRAYLNQSVEDALLSPDEEAEVRLAVSSLDLDFNLTPEQQERWDRFRWYWDVQLGALEPVAVDIHLQKTETCYFTAPSTWFEQRTRTRSIRYSGPAARIRIAKGLYWRMGSANIGRVTEDVLKQIDEGRLYFTSKRVIFLGDNRNTNIRLNRVLDFTLYSDGIELAKDSGRNPIFQLSGDIDIAALILNRLVTGEPPLDGPSRVEIVEARIDAERVPALGDARQALPAGTHGGQVDGRHYTEYVEEVKQLKRERRHTEAIELLERLIAAVEEESEATGQPAAPWYYEQLAIVHRKEKDYPAEVEILQRYEEQRKRADGPPDALTVRLTKAQALALQSL